MRLKMYWWLCLVLFFVATAAPSPRVSIPPLIVEESDGSPSVKGTSKIIVTNGKLTQSGSTATLDLSGGGGGAPTDAQYVTLSTNGSLSAERVLTGTANQIILTDGGANGNITLSTPQSIGTGSSPSFTGLTVSGLTLGSIPFAGTGGLLSQDNTALFWDNTNKRLGLNTTAPTAQLSFQEQVGAELTTNGTFTGGSTGWTLGAGWAYNSNAVDKSSDGTATLTPNPALSVTAGKVYRVNFTVTNWTVGTVTPAIGGSTGDARGANGTYSCYFFSGTTGNLTFTPTNTARFTIDDISVKLVTHNLDTLTNKGPLIIDKTLSLPTGNQAAMVVNYTVNKATSGNDTGLLVNMIDVGTPGSSILLDLQVGGTSKFKVSDGGHVTIGGNVITTSLASQTLILNNNNISTIDKFAVQISSGIFSQTSGTNGVVKINPTYNQTSGTAANTDLLVNRTETAMGSGAQLFVDLQSGASGGTSRLSIDNTGKIKFANSANNTTGAGTALLGTNSPAITVSAPYTWFTFVSSDGSTVYVPAWK